MFFFVCSFGLSAAVKGCCLGGFDVFKQISWWIGLVSALLRFLL